MSVCMYTRTRELKPRKIACQFYGWVKHIPGTPPRSSLEDTVCLCVCSAKRNVTQRPRQITARYVRTIKRSCCRIATRINALSKKTDKQWRGRPELPRDPNEATRHHYFFMTSEPALASRTTDSSAPSHREACFFLEQTGTIGNGNGTPGSGNTSSLAGMEKREGARLGYEKNRPAQRDRMVL